MRLKKLLKNLSKSNKFPYYISDLTNINYLTGFKGSYGNLIIDDHRIFFITDSRYVEYAESILPPSVEINQQEDSLFKSLVEILKSLKKKKLYIEHSVSLANYLLLQKELKNIKILPGDDEVSFLRIVKDEEELAVLKKAVDLADKCFNHLLKIIKPGVIEWDLAVEIEYFYRKNGCRRSSFDSVVASGKGSSMPHYMTSMTKTIKNGDIVLIDMGCEFNGYNSDLTRTVFVGSIDSEFETIYKIVKEAQERAISTAKPGITAGAIDKKARDFIDKAGYGWAFGHALGHGVGLEVHEKPAIKRGSSFRFKKNIPVTIEPGIYLPDKGGVRIEDIIVITGKGYDNLTGSTKDIIIL